MIDIKDIPKEKWGNPMMFSLGELNDSQVSHCVYNSAKQVIAEGSYDECADFISDEREKEIQRIMLGYRIRHIIGNYFFDKDVKPLVYPAIDGGVCYGYGGICDDGVPMFPVLELRVMQKKLQVEEETANGLKEKIKDLIGKFS